MSTRQKQVGKFLLPAVVLALAAIFVFPMQQALASGGSCGGSCDGNGGSKNGGSKCCGSLVNVQGNNVGNVKTGDFKVGNIENNKIKVGNVKTGDILSGNKVKFLNDNDILSYNKILSSNKFLNYNKIKVGDVPILSGNGEFASHIGKYNEVLSDIEGNNVPIVSGNTLKAFKLLGCGC